MAKILGIDEAGRGALCGPMVIAGAMIDSKDEKKLKELGVKDSKMLTPKERERIRPELDKLVQFKIFKVDPKQIDDNNLNHLEFDIFSQVINELDPDKVFVDAFESNCEKVHGIINSKLNKPVKLICENKADSNYLIVGAASIIAKTHRDREIEKLKEKYGDFGTGYPSDPKCIQFMKDWVRKNRFLPAFVRKKWQTVDEILQTKLGEFR